MRQHKERKKKMAKFYDISAKITNELPTLKITDELVVTVNNRKNTILNVQATVAETEKKTEEDAGEEKELAMMNKALKMLLGEKNAAAIEEMDLPVPEYSEVFRSVMMVAQGKEPDEDMTP